MSGPYIVTTTEERLSGLALYRTGVSRVAVATLEDPPSSLESGVRGTLYAMVPEETTAHQYDDVYEAIDALPESGGTITLPDGTVIEVEQKAWRYLALAAGLPVSVAERADDDGRLHQRILDAFNAQEAKR